MESDLGPLLKWLKEGLLLEGSREVLAQVLGAEKHMA
jgi:hypothetical protein